MARYLSVSVSEDVFIHIDDRREGRVFTCLSVCLPAFFRISKTDAGLPNLTKKHSTTSRIKPFILGSKCQRSRSRITKHCCHGSLHSCGCWLPSIFATAVTGANVVHSWMRAGWNLQNIGHYNLYSTNYRTRLLYCVEWPQYSIRLEELGYLCTSCLLPALTRPCHVTQ